MPSYYNPYNFFPASYAGAYPMQNPQPGIPQPSSVIDTDLLMKWVEGEVGAKAFQMPQGWPVNKPIPLWDTTDTVIWIKSWNQIGAPNPMQKLKYEMQDQPQITLPASTDMSKYVTSEDMEKFKEEIQALISKQNVQNRQNGSQGGNR